MVDLIQELITDTVVGASIGSVITLFGVWITNRFQQKSMEKDREFKLKSELYMSAIEEINQLKILLCKLPHVSQKEIDSIKGAALAKLTVIATNETVQAITEFSTAINVKILHLMPEKISLDNLRYNIMEKDNDEKNAQLNKGTNELFIKGIKATISLTELEVTAISCIRKELNLPFNEAKYRNIVQKANKKWKPKSANFWSEYQILLKHTVGQILHVSPAIFVLITPSKFLMLLPMHQYMFLPRLILPPKFCHESLLQHPIFLHYVW